MVFTLLSNSSFVSIDLAFLLSAVERASNDKFIIASASDPWLLFNVSHRSHVDALLKLQLNSRQQPCMDDHCVPARKADCEWQLSQKFNIFRSEGI